MLVAIEMVDRTRSTRESAQAEKMRGQILQTYCWKDDGDGYFYCGDTQYRLPALGQNEEDWRLEIYRDVLLLSTMIAVNSHVGVSRLRGVADVLRSRR